MAKAFQPDEDSKNQEEESIRATIGQFQPEESKGNESPMSQITEPILENFMI